MNENDYYSKYLKYKMKYLREKSLQIGGIKLKAHVQIISTSKIIFLTIFYDNEKTIGDIKDTIFKMNKEYPIDKQTFQYRGKTPKDTDIFNSIYPNAEKDPPFTVYIEKEI